MEKKDDINDRLIDDSDLEDDIKDSNEYFFDDYENDQIYGESSRIRIPSLKEFEEHERNKLKSNRLMRPIKKTIPAQRIGFEKSNETNIDSKTTSENIPIKKKSKENIVKLIEDKYNNYLQRKSKKNIKLRKKKLKPTKMENVKKSHPKKNSEHEIKNLSAMLMTIIDHAKKCNEFRKVIRHVTNN